MATKTIGITAGQDIVSVGWNTDHWYFWVDPADTDIGWVSNAINRQGHALRFLNIPIPPGSTIVYSYIEYRGWGTYEGDVVRSYIRAEKNLAPQPFTTYANYIARPRTTAKSDWSNIPHWFPRKRYKSIDFTSVIQEVINQPGWAEGNPIVVFCNDHDDRSDHIFGCTRHGWAYSVDPALAPILHLSYTPPGGTPPQPGAGETYTIGGDTLQKVDHPTWAGQTFRPVESHVLEYVDLQMRGMLFLPEPVIQIFKADANHEPYGDYLSRNIYTVEKHCGLFKTARARFKMTPYLLEAGQYYVIIVSNFPPILGYSAYWQYDNGDATYLRGLRISTPDGGATWTKHYNDDFLFAEFGTPPLPKPEPPPPIDHFALPDIIYFHTTDGIMTYFSTSVPCHLTCYWTDKVPQKHPISRTIRGLTVPWSTYFCFVAWHTVEQNEAGDTLYHTFELIPWTICATRWFTVRGDINNILSPSVGPIFKKHYPGPTPPQKFESYEDPKQTYSSIYEPHRSAQTFIPTQTQLLTKVYTLMTRATNTYPNLYLEIKQAPDDIPTGPILSSGYTVWAVIPDGAVPAWVETPMSHLILKPGVKYAIITRTTGIGAGILRWWRRYFDATYPRGIRIYSTDSGNTWSKIPLHDFLFQEWGIPPEGV